MKKQCTKRVEKRRVPGTGNRVHGGPRREPEPSSQPANQASAAPAATSTTTSSISTTSNPRDCYTEKTIKMGLKGFQ